MKRFAAVFTLAVLAPAIAEYLSGSMSLAQIGALPVMLALYGGGAVLIRESVRRAGRSWPSILLLGLAYALIEEGLADQSLFNPNFLGLHLTAPGYIPALGIGLPWTLYVLAIHVIWSIAVPIALAESLFPSHRSTPWLGRVGLGVTALLYAAGVAAITAFFASKFFAAPAQIAAALILAAVLVFAAFKLPRPAAKRDGDAPSPLIAGLSSFGLTFAFVLVYGQGIIHWPWQAVAGGLAALIAIMLTFAVIASRHASWNQPHLHAIGAGALLTYCITGFGSEIALHGPAMLWAHAILVAVLVAVTVLAGIKARASN
jgi:hypothetical protein